MNFQIHALDPDDFNALYGLPDAELAKGTELNTCINTFFENENISYLHFHHATHGCYVAKVARP